MPGVLVVYHARGGHTRSMAERIRDALMDEGLDVTCKRVEDTGVHELLSVDGVVIGSPTYYGTMSAEIKKFLHESVKHHTTLDGKVGAAFATSGTTSRKQPYSAFRQRSSSTA